MGEIVVKVRSELTNGKATAKTQDWQAPTMNADDGWIEGKTGARGGRSKA